MRRLDRRSAGRRVLARADRLSDDLLVVETVCFGQIRDAFAAEAADAEAVFRAAWARAGTAKVVAGDRALAHALQVHQSYALLAAQHCVDLLADKVIDLSTASLRDELVWCEETLAKDYAGIAEAAVTAAGASVDVVTVDRLKAFSDVTVWSATRYAQMMSAQFQKAALYDEQVETVVGRLFSMKPLRLVGRAGKGVWWDAASDLNGAARDVSIRLSTQIRQSAMRAFNEVGAGRV